MASRIAAVLTIPEQAAHVYQPLVLPLAVSGLGLWSRGCPSADAPKG